ncbi:MAG: RNA-binding domain-containing protein [Micrococcaceae bacterium]
MIWDAPRLVTVLGELRRHRNDTTLIEVKRAGYGVPQGLPTTLCAFANMPEGGHIILGVDEAAEFAISGVADVGNMEQAIANQARTAVEPPPQVDFTVIPYDGLQVLIAQVHPLPISEKPARYQGRAYLRQADGDYEMAPSDLQMMEIAKLHRIDEQNYDIEPVTGTSLEDLDSRLTDMFLDQVRRTSSRLRGLTDHEILSTMGVVAQDGRLTVAGLYAMGRYPQGPKPALGVSAAVQLPRDESASNTARTRNLTHFDGPLPDLLEDVMAWIRQNLGSDQVYDRSGHLHDRLELPVRGIREAVANALVHRDLGPHTLGMGKQIEIRIDSRRLMIMNPGGLRGLTVSRLESNDLAKAAVNQRLHGIAKHLRTPDDARIIEGEGGGVREILLSAREAGLQKPKLIDTGVEFRAILWRGSPFSAQELAWLGEQTSHRLSHIQQTVLLTLENGASWSPERVNAEFAPISREDATQQLVELQQWGLIEIDRDQENQVRLADSTAPESPVKQSAPTTKPISTPRSPDDPYSKNGRLVLGRISNGSNTVSSISQETGLTKAQVRYALKTLVSAGAIQRSGGQGHQDTTYFPSS